jgi:hypothetical protein
VCLYVWNLRVILSLRLIKYYTLKAYGGVVEKLHAFLISALEWSKWSASRSVHFDPEYRSTDNSKIWGWGGGGHACPDALETIKTSFPCPALKNVRQCGITGKNMWDLRWTTCYWKKCFIYYFCFPLSRSHHQFSTFMTQYKLSSLRVSLNKTFIPSLKTQVFGDPVNDLVTVSTELPWFH